MSAIIEYMAIGTEVYAIHEDGAEEFALQASSQESAEELASRLNAKLAQQQLQESAET